VTWKFITSVLDWSITQPERFPENQSDSASATSFWGRGFRRTQCTVATLSRVSALQAATPQLIWKQPRSRPDFLVRRYRFGGIDERDVDWPPEFFGISGG
jgi:hypothetical protein